MIKRHLPKLLALTVFTAGVFAAYGNLTPKSVFSAADHILISEVQVTGSSDADDEFVELYNPTENPVSLNGWRLTKKVSGGTETNLIASMSGNIASHGYFLVAKPGAAIGVTPDEVYSAASNSLAVNNTVLVYDNALVLKDKVGMGTATDNETVTIVSPTAGQSVERKANSTSTVGSMTTGVDQNMGNGEDTDNNANDFVVRTVSDPQNSSSVLEPITATPTPTPTLVPSPTPTSTPSGTPTATASTSPTPTPTDTPTSTPTSSPSPSATPAPSATPNPMTFTNPLFTCTITYMNVGTGFIRFVFPKLSCTPNR